ncbi:hypothetical protein V6N13_004839 [Hibiscus sabdariffa]
MNVWGSLAWIEDGTEHPALFERGRIQIITTRVEQIDDVMYLEVEGRVLSIRAIVAPARVNHLWEVSHRLDLGDEAKHLVENSGVSDEHVGMMFWEGQEERGMLNLCKASVDGLDFASNQDLKTKYVKYKRLTMKVRSMPDIILSFVSPAEREEAYVKLAKRGHGKPCKKERPEIANGFLSNSNFQNRDKLILKQA